MIGIYKIINPTGKIYIGQAININKRWKQYKTILKQVIGSKLYNSLNKYGVETHQFEIIEECLLEQLNERELFWGKHYDVLGPNGLNLRLGDANGKMSEETKQKISQSLLGRKITWEIKGNTSKNRVYSKERNLNISTSLKNKPKTEQHKLNIKMSKSKSILQYDLEENFIKEWESGKEAGNSLFINKSNIAQCCRNKVKTAGGFKWKYNIIKQNKIKQI